METKMYGKIIKFNDKNLEEINKLLAEGYYIEQIITLSMDENYLVLMLDTELEK